MNLGTGIVLLLLAVAVCFAVRAIRRHKTGGCCGDCAGCPRCAGRTETLNARCRRT